MINLIFISIRKIQEKMKLLVVLVLKLVFVIFVISKLGLENKDRHKIKNCDVM